MADVKINIEVVSRAAQQAVTKLGNSAKGTENQFKRLNLSVNNTTSAFKVFLGNIASSAVSAFARSVGSLAGAAFEATKGLETIATQFEVLTGSASKASVIIKDIQQFAANTPFQFKDIAKAGQRLLSFGFQADTIVDKLKNIGDISAASGANISELSLIFGQVSAAGKLTGERLLQLQERAIPIGPALAKTMGVAESSIRDLVSKGKVDFATFEKAFQSLNKEGEFAFNGTAKRANTLEGRISTLKDNFELFAASIGNTFAPAIKVVISSLTSFIQNLTNTGGLDDFLSTIRDGIPSALRIAGDSLIFLNDSFQNTRQFVNIIRAAFNSLAVGIVDSSIAILEAAASTKEFFGLDTSGLKDTISTLKTLSETFEEVAIESLTANAAIENSQISVDNTINAATGNIIASYRKQLEESTIKTEGVLENDVKETVSLAEKISLTQLLSQEAAESREEDRQNELNAIALAGNAEFEFLQNNLNNEEAARVAAQAQELINQGKHDKAKEVLAGARIKAEANRKATEDELDRERISSRRSTLSTIATLQSSNNKTLALIGKAAAITQIAIDGPIAVTKALAAFPPPFNFAAATLVGVAVAAQAAKIAGLSFEQGGVVPGNSFSGDNVAARVNSGEMILNRQQQSQLFEIANGGGGGGQPIIVNTTVELDGDVLARSVSKSVANGVRLGEFE